MKTFVRMCIALGATVFAAACSPSNPPADSGVTTDTGVGGDSSSPTDSGVPGDSSAPADSGVTPADGSGGGDRAAACTAYCTAVTRACTGANMQYADMAACQTACMAATYEIGMPTMTSGNTIGCRTYHAGAAMADPATHCSHAGPTGGGVCQ